MISLSPADQLSSPADQLSSLAEQLSSPAELDFPYSLEYPESDCSDSPPSSPIDPPTGSQHLQLSLLVPAYPGPPLLPALSSPVDSCYPSPMDTPLTPFSPHPLQLAEKPTARQVTALLPDPTYSFPPSDQTPNLALSQTCAPARTVSSRVSDMAHPYARLYNKRDGAKRRKMWNHALEKAIFTPQEISTMGAPHRRTIYTASLESHIDRLHAQLLDYALFPVPFERLEPLRGLNSKTAKSMVAGLERDASELRLKRLELQRSNEGLRELLRTQSDMPAGMHSTLVGLRRHSLDATG